MHLLFGSKIRILINNVTLGIIDPGIKLVSRIVLRDHAVLDVDVHLIKETVEIRKCFVDVICGIINGNDDLAASLDVSLDLGIHCLGNV